MELSVTVASSGTGVSELMFVATVPSGWVIARVTGSHGDGSSMSELHKLTRYRDTLNSNSVLR